MFKKLLDFVTGAVCFIEGGYTAILALLASIFVVLIVRKPKETAGVLKDIVNGD